jgi:hypothetical protein
MEKSKSTSICHSCCQEFMIIYDYQCISASIHFKSITIWLFVT